MKRAETGILVSRTRHLTIPPASARTPHMRTARMTMIIALTVAAVALPTAAGACDDPGPDFTAVYVYQKDNPELGASWENSGPQTLIVVNDGHQWVQSISASSLPDGVCGPGWGVQQDFVTGIAREKIPDRVDRATNVGVLKWPPIVDAKHGNLSSYVTVPDCIEETPVTLSLIHICRC